MRVERIGDATLYLGDCRAIGLPHCDRIITDPVWPTCPAGFLAGSNDPQGLLREALDRMPAKTVVIVLGFDCDPRFLDAVPVHWPFIRSQQLPYAVPGYRGRLLGGDEVAYVFGSIPQGRGVIPGRAPTETTTKASRANGHPSPRSQTHMRALVGWWSNPGDVVMDPFMGSGSTGAACASLGRAFVGVECDERYFDIACRQIDDAYRQRTLGLELSA